MRLLEVNNIVSGYGKIPILHGISMHVDEGEMVGVIGPNGAGKTTLMHTISRLLPLMQGEIRFLGEDISNQQASQVAQKGLGYVPQRRNVFTDLTVEENLLMGAYSVKHPKQAISEVLEIFPDLKSRMKQYAGTLSGGQRQMLALASALIMKPRLLLLDEPITGLAPQIIQGLIDLIVDIREKGTTVVWVVEENPRQVLQKADRVYLIDAGQVRVEYTGKEFLDAEDFEEIFLGTHN